MYQPPTSIDNENINREGTLARKPRLLVFDDDSDQLFLQQEMLSETFDVVPVLVRPKAIVKGMPPTLQNPSDSDTLLIGNGSAPYAAHDADDLAALLEHFKPAAIVTDGNFKHNGGFAPQKSETIPDGLGLIAQLRRTGCTLPAAVITGSTTAPRIENGVNVFPKYDVNQGSAMKRVGDHLLAQINQGRAID